MGWGWNGWFMGWMGLFWFGLLVVIIWALFSSSRRGSAPPPHRETPEEILKRRYASGEINQEQYHRMLEELRR
jgi:putative membrane protein